MTACSTLPPSSGPEAGGGVCAWIEASTRAALSIERRDIFFLPGVAIPKLLLGDVGYCPLREDFLENGSGPQIARFFLVTSKA